MKRFEPHSICICGKTHISLFVSLASKASSCLPPPNLLLISHAEEVHFVKMAAGKK